MYNDFHMAHCFSRFASTERIFCVDHCREERIEHRTGQDRHYYIEAGDMRVDRRVHHSGHVEFPVSHYHGITIGFFLDEAENTIREAMPAASVDISALAQKFCGEDGAYTLAVGKLKALFASAYAEGIIECDPSVSIIRPKAKKKTERRVLTDQETENVLNTIQNHEQGLFLAVLYYLGLRRDEALGLQWGDFDFDEDLVHIQRDIDYVGSTAHDGALKTAAANRYIPVPQELRAMLSKVRGFQQQYVFHTEEGQPWSQSSFKRIWLSLMEASYCVEEREVIKRKNDIIKQLKPTLTPHYFRHNYATLLFEAGVEPLIAMKILGHTDYQTTANIYTHLKSEMMKNSSVDMEEVFRRKQEAKSALAKTRRTRDKRSRKPVMDMSLLWAGRF